MHLNAMLEASTKLHDEYKQMSNTWAVRVEKDHLTKIATCSPERALSELIWNALDADATNVDLTFSEGALGIDEIIVRDNGNGLTQADARSQFSTLGGSWKSRTSRTKSGRFLHGKDGQGRFKAFALGRSVAWHIGAEDGSGSQSFQIEGLADDMNRFTLVEEPEDGVVGRGVTVRIRELHKQFRILDPVAATNKLLPEFAIYLSSYPGVSIRIGGEKLKYEDAIRHRSSVDLKPVEYGDSEHAVTLDIIEWNQTYDNELWFCGESVFPLEKYSRQIRGTGKYSYSAYMRSDLFTQLHRNGTLSLSHLNSDLQGVCEEAVSVIKEHFKKRQIEDGQKRIREWKAAEVYPYKSESTDPIEIAERQVFDMVAVSVSDSVSTLLEGDKQSKSFQLQMLKQALEKSPDEVQKIITEVLNLPVREREDLASLLQDVSLTGLISASKLVTDRLKFIAGLEHLLFDEHSKEHLKERSQLHKILSQNTWLFGNEFNLSVNDQSLTEVLRKHRSSLGEDTIVDEQVVRIDGTRGIVDLMMSRSIPCNKDDEIEHLVVELKAPKVKIKQAECNQIESYAFAVAEDERFLNLKATWNFVVVSNEMDSYTKKKTNQDNLKPGVIYKSGGNPNVTIWVKTWSQIIRENKHRLDYIRERINYSADKEGALAHLKARYAEFTEGVIVDEAEEVARNEASNKAMKL